MPTDPICNICKSKLKSEGTQPADLSSWLEDPIWLNDPIFTPYSLAGPGYSGEINIKKIHIDQLIVYWSSVCTLLSVPFPDKLTQFLTTQHKSVTKADIEALRLVVEQCLEEVDATIADYFKGDKYGEVEYTTAQVDWTDVDRIEKVPYLPERCSIKAIHIEELRRGLMPGFWKETWDPASTNVNHALLHFVPTYPLQDSIKSGFVDGDHSWVYRSSLELDNIYPLLPADLSQQHIIDIGPTAEISASAELIPDMALNEFGCMASIETPLTIQYVIGYYILSLTSNPSQYVSYKMVSCSIGGTYSTIVSMYVDGTVTTFPDLSPVTIKLVRKGEIQETYNYIFLTNTMNSNPGIGKLKFNKSDLTSPTTGGSITMYICNSYYGEGGGVEIINEFLQKFKKMNIKVTPKLHYHMPTLTLDYTTTSTILESSGLPGYRLYPPSAEIACPGFYISIAISVTFSGGILYKHLNYYWGTPGYEFYSGSFRKKAYPENTYILNTLPEYDGEVKRNIYDDCMEQFPYGTNFEITGVILGQTMTNFCYAHPGAWVPNSWKTNSTIDINFNDIFIKSIT